MTPVIFTEKTQCRDCYKCVRHCPVKAIRVVESSATVDQDLCIFCGRCVDVCPAGAKKVRDDIPRAKQLLQIKEQVYVSLAPSYPAVFPDEGKSFLAGLSTKGIAGISETALGAEAVTREQRKILDEGSGLQISSACPTVRLMAKRYFPEAEKAVSTVPSPMVAHARMLRRWFGKEIGIIFIGPCISKKTEADTYPELIDVALTFSEAADWLGEEILSGESTACEFVPFQAGKASLFPVDGGMIRAMEKKPEDRYRSFHQSGPAQVLDTLKRAGEMKESNFFLELLSCEGGCINGPGIRRNLPSIQRQAIVLNTWEQREACSALEYTAEDVGDKPWQEILPAPAPPSEMTIEETLKLLGKRTLEDFKDCGGCGYPTCREFAIGYIQGKAEKEMCVTEMRKIAQNKISALLHTIPMGVVIVDHDMRIVECNRHFLSLFADIPFDADQGTLKRAEGTRIAAFLEEYDLFGKLLTRKESQERIIQKEGKVMRGNFFQIQEGRFVGAVFQDITAPSVKREMVVKKAEEVIRKNLESVQQIAGLLGENAAETEIILNSLINAFEPGELRRNE